MPERPSQNPEEIAALQEEVNRTLESTPEQTSSLENINKQSPSGKPDVNEHEKLSEEVESFDSENTGSNAKKRSRRPYKPDGYWKNISEEELIKEIESRGLDPKNLPSSKSLAKANNRDLVAGLAQYYGSFTKAREELSGIRGRRPAGYWKNISEEELIKEIESRGLDPKNLPSHDDLLNNIDLLQGLQQRYGTLGKARIALGQGLLIKPLGYWPHISEEELIKEIESRGLDPKNLPPVHKLSKTDNDLVQGLTGRFGNYSKARQALGGDLLRKPPGYWQNISEEDLIEEIKSRGLDPKNLPNSKALIESGNVDLQRGLSTKYGSWNLAIQALGGEILRSTRFPKNNKEVDFVLSKWLTKEQIAAELGESPEVIKLYLHGLQGSKRLGVRPPLLTAPAKGGKRNIRNYSPELIEIIRNRLESNPIVPPMGWRPLSSDNFLDINAKTATEIIERNKAEHPEWVVKIAHDEHDRDYVSPQLNRIIRAEIYRLGTLPDGWLTNQALADVIGRNGHTTKRLVEAYRETHPEWFKKFIHPNQKVLREYYSPELVKIISKKFEDGDYKPAPPDWKNLEELSHLTGKARETVRKITLPYRESNPEWFGKFVDENNKVLLFHSPELVKIIFDNLSSSDEKEKLQTEIEGLAKEIQEGKTVQAQELQQLFNLFGHSNSVDILYKFDPRYRKLPVGFVKSILADYLGDFLVSRTFEIRPEELNIGLRFLDDQKFQDHLFEVMKNDALVYYNHEKVNHEQQDALMIIESYIDRFRQQTSHLQNTNLEEVLSRLESYYESIFSELSKPDNIVESMNGKRAFPDFYQQINIKEMSDKKKMLLADYMGVGKSASAILTKEYLGLKCGLVVAPSNVIDTWRGYLSDEKDRDGKQIGYFKEGIAPRVLEIENINDLRKLQEVGASYDYILISQEKLTQKYAEELSKIDTDMLIVDEAHKLKNIKSGVRATTLLRLAKNIEGEDKYLALLSGTPIPNKVQDIAIVLKLLYPEEFAKVKDKDLVRNIIDTDIIDLRAKLLPRMQMKELSGIEMPKLEEKLVSLELSQDEQLVYEMLMEEDELTATDKLRILRQFLLNPELLDTTPGFESTKISSVGESLREAFQTKDKVVVFFNGYIENIIRGESTIIPQLNLPPDVEVRIITGQVSREERKQIQEDLKISDKKILLLVSGSTADVGVDFSAADHVMFYNEPWSKSIYDQQLARVNRPGLKHDLESETFIVKDSIEEGIHLYTKAKEQAVEKLLRGIPRTEIEKKLLSRDEKQASQNLEVNPELARYYFSDWDKMMKIFAYVKEIGVEDFQNFLQKFGREYASCYVNLGSRSYQANADRVCGTLIDSLAKEDGLKPDEIKVLDIASGPEMLKKHIPEDYKDRVISMDINREHFKGEGDKRVVGSFLNLPFEKESVDFANFSLALHYTQFLPSRNNYERLEALLELNRVLKPGGKAVINMIYSLDFKDEESFKEIVGDIGFKIIEGYSGNIEVGQNYKSKVITLQKEMDPLANGATIKQITEQMGREKLNGLKLIENKVSVRDTRKIITEFAIGDKQFKVNFNRQDVNVLEEEREIIQRGESLKTQFGSIGDISKEQVIQNGFTRILIKDKYILFKKLEKAEGVAVIR